MVPAAIPVLVCFFQSIYAADHAGKKVSDLRFTPVTLAWQKESCRVTDTQIAYDVEDVFASKGTKLGIPEAVVKIRGDGNCYFRSISFCVTGRQDDHRQIRAAIVHYMKTYMQNEVSSSHLEKMSRDGAWGTHHELLATARLLDTPVIVYADYDRKGRFEWVQYTPREDYDLVYDDSIPRIYLRCNNIHYDVIQEVKEETPSHEKTYTETATSSEEANNGNDDDPVSQITRRFCGVMRSSRGKQQSGSSRQSDGSFSYTPVDWEWQSNAALTLGINTIYNMENYWKSKGSKLSKPKRTAEMDHEGNTFFQAISYCVIGEEHAHSIIRRKVANFIASNKDRLKRYKMSKEEAKNLASPGKEPPDGAIRATAHFLRTPIFVYRHMPSGWEWGQYTSKQDNTLETDDSLPRIYLKLSHKSYQVVLEVE